MKTPVRRYFRKLNELFFTGTMRISGKEASALDGRRGVRKWIAIPTAFLVISMFHVGFAADNPIASRPGTDPIANLERILPANINPSASIRLKLTADKATYTAGDDLAITAEADKDCRLTVLYVWNDGSYSLLMPLPGQDGKVKAGKPTPVSGGGTGLDLRLDGKQPIERIVAIASAGPNPILGPADFVNQNGELKFKPRPGETLADVLRKRTAGLGVQQPWGTAELAVHVGAGSSSRRTAVAMEGGEKGAVVNARQQPPSPDQAVTVTLHINSGLPNPTWTLTREQAAELANRFQGTRTKSLDRSEAPPVKLGYRGFTVTGLPTEGGGGALVFKDAIISGNTQSQVVSGNHELENMLLMSAGSAVDPEIKAMVQREIRMPLPPVMKSLGQKSVFEAPKWNNSNIIRDGNNCYNYSNNRITNTFAQPGMATGKKFDKLSCENVIKGATSDGLIPIPQPIPTPDAQIVALVFRPQTASGPADYHWYRLDSNGTWSHKPGQSPAIDYDESGQKIYDPRSANRGPYTQFCGFFMSVPDKVQIDGPKRLP